mmetsp:Transcript_16337/g.44319  ORF Transcript_16337/g.44319 Transcript_16337/m.44319 type:complete len:218 (-) Transcript_16337:105-758(-)
MGRVTPTGSEPSRPRRPYPPRWAPSRRPRAPRRPGPPRNGSRGWTCGTGWGSRSPARSRARPSARAASAPWWTSSCSGGSRRGRRLRWTSGTGAGERSPLAPSSLGLLAAFPALTRGRAQGHPDGDGALGPPRHHRRPASQVTPATREEDAAARRRWAGRRGCARWQGWARAQRRRGAGRRPFSVKTRTGQGHVVCGHPDQRCYFGERSGVAECTFL